MCEQRWIFFFYKLLLHLYSIKTFVLTMKVNLCGFFYKNQTGNIKPVDDNIHCLNIGYASSINNQVVYVKNPLRYLGFRLIIHKWFHTYSNWPTTWCSATDGASLSTTGHASAMYTIGTCTHMVQKSSVQNVVAHLGNQRVVC